MKKQMVKWLDDSGFHRLAYYEWGEPTNSNIAICAHGLTRNGRDFDYLARSLQKDYRVICPDFPGRGQSDWLDIKNNYDYPYYLQAFTALIAQLNCKKIVWIGTSMGGLTGMLMASLPNTPICKLVLNDIGPEIPATALAAIGEYVGKQPEFETLDALKQYLKVIHSGFGKLTEEQWQHLAEHSHRVLENGRITLGYDPDIAEPFKKLTGEEINLWPVWSAIHCPILVLRGTESPLLTEPTAKRMAERSQVTLIEFPETGHAPALMSEEQIAVIQNWLETEPTAL